MRFTRGFTLIELLVTLAVLAVVISIAAPSFNNILQENRTLSLTNELQGALQLARSEAVKRRKDITICGRNAAGNGCQNGTDWAGGWIIMAGNVVIKSWDGTGNMAVAGPNAGLTFRPNGMIVTTDDQPIVLSVNASTCVNQQKRELKVSIIGTTSTTKVNCS
ncbi:GspH/FimT family pseudopilin [Pseudomonas yangonensis]|uniref:GspH/FimT family pseudopilin n=1 Tax=Pseudomonas yangonensis TaxID=2579922 RepID=UPI0013794A6D|nr:GspH/FimT family pseudopilin [Pseudomonas yangonensis]